MKDIKTFLIGFLTCACMFLIMGQTKADNDDYEMEMNVSGGTIKVGNEYGRYHISTSIRGNIPYVYETIIDTKTGEIFKREKVKVKQYNKIDFD